MKRLSVSLIFREMQIKAEMRYSHPLEWLSTKNRTIKHVSEDGEKLEP